jgi:hypothetical protein
MSKRDTCMRMLSDASSACAEHLQLLPQLNAPPSVNKFDQPNV